MIECYEDKFVMICRYQYVSLPLPPKWHKWHKFCYANITARKSASGLNIGIEGNSSM